MCIQRSKISTFLIWHNVTNVTVGRDESNFLIIFNSVKSRITLLIKNALISFVCDKLQLKFNEAMLRGIGKKTHTQRVV